jgi:choline-sulfatase
VTRNDFLKTGLMAGASQGLNLSRAAQAGRRPKNVLFLLSDQHRPHAIGADGDPYARTPNLDSFARSAVRFDSAYCANPVCTPSRASILSGLYTHNHRAYTNTTPWPFEVKTMAHAFSRAGYMSALIGKMHFVDAQTHGFDYRLDFNDWFQYLGPKTKLYADELSRANSGSGLPQIDDLWRDFGDPWKDAREKDGRLSSVHPGRASKIPERDHFENFVSRESIRFLKNFAKQQPFFLTASYLKPHDPFMPPERFAKTIPVDSVKLPDTWGKVNLDAVPKDIRRRIENDAPTPELKDPAAARNRISMYYGNVAHLDECIGQVLAALREMDLEKDTIVIYSSDHGDMLGDHGLWGKFVMYDPSAGVPLIIRVPGVTPEGKRCASPVSQVQLFATLAELCGLSLPHKTDGESLLPCLREPDRRIDAPVFSEFALRNPGAKYMIRRGDWKYNFYANDTDELYNLREDPKEMSNLADKERSRAGEMKSQLFAWYKPPEIGMKKPAN